MKAVHVRLARLPFILLFFLLSDFIVSACTSALGDQPTTITPTDKSAGTLTVAMTVTEDQNDLFQVSTIDMHFSSNQVADPNPNTVDFMNESKINCNNTYLNFNGSDYANTVPTDANGAYNCTYTWNGVTTTFPTDNQPLLSPSVDAHGNLITINYNSSGGDGCLFEVNASDGSHSITATSKQNNGAIKGIDISTLSGPGTLMLTRTCKLTSTSAGFKSVAGTYIATATLYITWDKGQ